MSVRSILLNAYKYPLPEFPTYYDGIFGATGLVVQDAVQEVEIDNLPSTAELAVLGITDPVIVFSLTNDSAFTGMLTGYSNVDYDAQTCSAWICYANDTAIDIRFWVCQAQ